MLKNPTSAGYVGLIPGLGRSPEEANGNPFSILAWEILWTEEPGRVYIVHGATKESNMT